MLTALEVENFKGIGCPIRVELGPITLLFGSNSAGKSTIIHALHYAHEILSRRNFDPDETHHGGDVVDLGGFLSFVHGHDLTRSVRLRLELDLKDRDLPELPFPPSKLREEGEPAGSEDPVSSLDLYNDGLSARIETAWLGLSVQWSSAREAPVLRGYEVGVNNELVGRIEASADGAQVELVPNLPHPLFSYDGRLSEGEQLELQLVEARWLNDGPSSEAEYWRGHGLPVAGLSRSSLPRWGELLRIEYDEEDDFYAYPFREFRYRISTLLVGVGQLLRDELAQLRYLGPMRDVVSRIYSAPRLVDPRRWANGLGAWDLLLARDDEFIREVSDWLSSEDRLDTGYGLAMRSFIQVPVDGPLVAVIRQGRVLDDVEDLAAELGALPVRKELQLVVPSTLLPVSPYDVGLGVSQVLPVVVAALDPDRPGVTVIEQPELHIHPRIEVELGDLFAQQAADGRIFLLETHSEHLVLRLLRRIEETTNGELPTGKPELRADQLSVVYVEQVDGEVNASRLRVDETGEFIDRWPRGFFEERARELF